MLQPLTFSGFSAASAPRIKAPRVTVMRELSPEGFRGHLPSHYIPLPGSKQPGQTGASISANEQTKGL
jgi:hypothetical protein